MSAIDCKHPEKLFMQKQKYDKAQHKRFLDKICDKKHSKLERFADAEINQISLNVLVARERQLLLKSINQGIQNIMKMDSLFVKKNNAHCKVKQILESQFDN